MSDWDDFKALADYCQAQALSDKLRPGDEAVWRQFCRKYSRTFYTPLHVVELMDPVKVLLAVYEDQLENVDVDDNMEAILDIIYSLEDPDYAKEKRDDLKQFIKDAEAEEEYRKEAGKPIHKLLAEEDSVSLKKSTPKNTPVPPNKNLPQGGGINLSYLEKEENGSNDDES